METYTALRQFADSWFLLVMFVFFVGVVLFTLRPGSKKTHDDIANIPLRDDDPSRLKSTDAGGNGDPDQPRGAAGERASADGDRRKRAEKEPAKEH